MNRMFTKFVVLFALIFSMAALPLMGQADRATISGTVTDVTGAVIPGVDVSATNVDTGVQTLAFTNDVGNYTLVNIPIGTYRITFELPGFKTYERTDFRVTTGQAARLDVILEVGEVTETVTISATAEIVNADNPQVSTTMQNDVITDLPFSFAGGRAVENFAYLVSPGVEGNNWTSYMVGGQAFSKEVYIDGISATAHIQGHIGESSPTMEAVQEFTVQTSGMSPEYGRTSGGVFNFALKSGTNDFNGSLFYYARNDALNANTWMNNWNLSQNPGDDRFKRARDRQFLGGGSAGGPIVIPGLYDGRDRTFIFGAFEHYQRESFQLGPMNRTVPIPAFLQGDFSALLTGQVVGQDALGRDVFGGQIFDPLTLRKVGGKWLSDPFPGNIIPQDRFSATSAKIVEMFKRGYLPMVPGRLTNNSALTQVNNPWFHQTQLTLKGDHAFSDSNKLTGSFIWTQRPRVLVDQGGIWDPLDPNGWGGPFARSRKQEVTSRRVVLTDNWTIQPNLINSFSAAYNRYRNPSVATADLAGGNWTEDFGLGSVSFGNFPDIQFGDTVNGISTDRIGYNANGFYVSNTYILRDSIDWIKGRHGFTFGGEGWWQQLNSPGSNDLIEFNFANWTTGHPKASYQKKVGFGFASFLLGEIDSASRNVPIAQYGRRGYVAFYANDDFKVNSRLTLNLGLRWEQAQPLREINGMWANFTPDALTTNPNGFVPIDPGVPGALQFATGSNTTFEGNRDWNGFSPRIGFAFRMTDKVVIRAGYGIFYSPIGTQQWGGVPYGRFAAPDMIGTDRVATKGKTVPNFNWDDGYTGNFQAPGMDPNFLTWGMVAFDENSLELGYTHQYNVSLQYSFDSDTMLETTFLGNDGNRLHSGFLRRNQARRDEYEALANPAAWVWDQGSAAAAGVPYPFPGFSGYAGMAILPFPQVAHCGWKACAWSPLLYVSSPLGESSYKSLQLNLTRRMSKGIASNISYTFSKTKGNTETLFDENWNTTGGIQDINNLAEAANTVVSYDQTHILKGLASFELPFGRGQKWLADSHGVLDGILGGWRVTTVFRYSSGRPLGINPDVWLPAWTDPPNGAVYANVESNANVNTDFDGKGFNPGDQSDPANNYFDASAFSSPAWGKLGNGQLRYDELRGFGFANEDIGLMKYWRFGEDARLQFRIEMLNVFNRHHFQDPRTRITNTATFAQVISTTGLPRNLQLGLRLNW
ncbi:TonB-dependent receptor [Acidobacteria bacterium AH-259-O06]|nr:TonB-dependent receptor [Acidobacteria bacterium AH-259-O06]